LPFPFGSKNQHEIRSLSIGRKILMNREDEISPRVNQLIVGLYEDWPGPYKRVNHVALVMSALRLLIHTVTADVRGWQRRVKGSPASS
jgi:hypothetical protein